MDSTKQIFLITMSLIKDSATDAVTWKNICTHATLFKKDLTTDGFLEISITIKCLYYYILIIYY